MQSPNLKYIEELSGEDELFKKKFISILKEEFPIERQEYQDNLLNKRFNKTSENVHKLKHKLNILGLHECYSLAVRYELELKNGKSSFSKEFDNILCNVASYLKTI